MNIIAAALFMLLPVVSGAQEARTVRQASGIELAKEKSLWFNTSNASGLTITPLDKFNEVSLQYQNLNGDFRRSQTGNENNVRLNTNGALMLGGTMMWGSFTYNNMSAKDSRFNTILFDPLRDMPYYVVDSIPSGWKRQKYDLRMKVGFPMLWNVVRSGIDIEYITRVGAKQNDPRTTDYHYNIVVRPGFTFQLAPQHHLGFNIEYENSYERTSPVNSDNQTDQNILIMRGLGNTVKGIVGGLGGISTFFYKGNRIGGALQYGWVSDRAFSLLLDARYHYKVEDAFQRTSKPERMGTVQQNFYRANLQMTVEKERSLHKVNVGYSQKNSDGIEFVQVIDNSYEVQQWVTIAQYIRSRYDLRQAFLKYDFFRKSDLGYSWRAGFKGAYVDQDDEYFKPNSVFNARNCYFEVFGKKDFLLGGKSNLLLGLNLGYNANIDGEYVYNGANADTPVVRKMYVQDLAYLTSNYMQIGGEARFSTMVSKGLSLFFSASCQGQLPGGSDFKNRVNILGSVGFNF